MQEIALKRLVRRREKSIAVKNQKTMSIKKMMDPSIKSKKRVFDLDTKTMKRIAVPRMKSTKKMMNLKRAWLKRQRKYKSYRRTVGKRNFSASVEKHMTRDQLERRLRQMGGDSLVRKQ